MIVLVVIVDTTLAEGEVLLTVIGDDAVHQSVVAKTVEDAVEGGPVNGSGNFLPKLIVAEGGIGLFQSGQDGGFGGRITTLHG